MLSFFSVLAVCKISIADSNMPVLERTTKYTPTETTVIRAQNDEKIAEKTIPKYIRGIHVSAWVSGSKKYKDILERLFKSTELNTAVIDIKEYEGEVYIDGVRAVDSIGAYVRAVPDLEKYISDLKEKDIYTIARIVVFRDNKMARKNPELAVKNPDGTVWEDKKGIAWLDPYNKNSWDYNLQIAEKAVDVGFDEIQFDYIRFPSDGNTKICCYSKEHSSIEASKILVSFLKEANRRLKTKDVKISIDVFGLTTAAIDDMGIGQKIVEMSQWVDYVSPMLYPSHYGRGNYGITEPNKEPYRTVYCSLENALRRIPNEKIRPWLQDFSLGYKYGKSEVKAQMQACYDNNVNSWLLWNPKCTYTNDALEKKNPKNILQPIQNIKNGKIKC
ncbi:MAG: putative glycoside hydrolase [Endomicrobium sp.]|nr:putative glycoside hydrolase [Endomicrobium sp.]